MNQNDPNVISILLINYAEMKPGLSQHIEELLQNSFKNEPELNSN